MWSVCDSKTRHTDSHKTLTPSLRRLTPLIVEDDNKRGGTEGVAGAALCGITTYVPISKNKPCPTTSTSSTKTTILLSYFHLQNRKEPLSKKLSRELPVTPTMDYRNQKTHRPSLVNNESVNVYCAKTLYENERKSRMLFRIFHIHTNSVTE